MQKLQILLWKDNYLWKLGKTRISKQRHMSQELMADVPVFKRKKKRYLWGFFYILQIDAQTLNTHGSGVYVGLELWRMYCVEWKTRKARPARKSRDESRPATGRSRKPVHAAGERRGDEREQRMSVWLCWIRADRGSGAFEPVLPPTFTQ